MTMDDLPEPNAVLCIGAEGETGDFKCLTPSALAPPGAGLFLVGPSARHRAALRPSGSCAAWHGWSPWLATSERRRSALRVGASAPQLREEKKAKPQVKEQVKAHSPPRARPVRQQPDQPADFRLFADGTAVPKPARYYRRIRSDTFFG